MTVSHPMLSRRPAHPAPTLPLVPGCAEMQLAQGRVHEASGPARRTFALWLAARTQEPVIWIAPPWQADRLNADGVQAWTNPARLIFVNPKRTEDLLWTMEEVLRSGATTLAIADLPALPGLTQVRRMHLAAETGASLGQSAPLGLLLTPGQGGAPGVETRWHLSCCHAHGQDNWRLERLRARTAPRKSWEIHLPAKSRTLTVKPKVQTKIKST